MSVEPEKSEEIEIKLDLGSSANYLKLTDFLGQINNENHQSNMFFDTENRILASHGWAFRIRLEKDRGLVTIKSLATEQGAAFIRQEIEEEIPLLTAQNVIQHEADIMKLEILPVRHIRHLIGSSNLKKLITFENHRKKKLLKIDDHDYLMEIDKTEFSNGVVDYELEIELSVLPQLKKVQNYVEKLFTSLDIPFVIQKESKLERALRHGGVSWLKVR